MYSLIFALPIVIADLSSRKIPNIYLIFYCYLTFPILLWRGFQRIDLTCAFAILLLLCSLLGMGMGDIKLIFLISLLIGLNSICLFVILFTSIMAFSLMQIFLIWAMSKVFPASIAMAPAIFMGTGLYLASGRG